VLARLEQLPESPESERMLREVRARIVDLDTGVTPSAMMPVDSAPALSMESTHAPKATTRPRPDAPQRKRPVVAARPEPRGTGVGLSAAQDREWLTLVAKNEVLSLDASASLPSGEPRSAQDRRPWTRGLRG